MISTIHASSRARTAGWLGSALAAMLAAATLAAPPANDGCAAASALALDRATAGTLVDAVNDYQLAAASPCFPATVGHSPSVAVGGDVVYSFTAAAAASYSFRVWSVLAGANPVLYTASVCPAPAPPNAVLVACVDAANRSGTAEEIGCRALAAGEQVFVFVDQAGAAAGAPFFVQGEVCSPAESEANDTPATADAAACALRGSIVPGSDVDVYSLGAPAAGSRIFALVETAASAASDADLRVTTPTDTLEFDDSNNDAKWGTAGPTVAGTIGTGAPILMRVSGALGTTQIDPYHLYTTVQPPSTAAISETEPNGDTATADFGYYVAGALGGPAPSTDRDFYGFQANAGDLLLLSLDADPERDNTPIDAAISLLDAAGALLTEASDADSGSDTTPGPGSLVSATPYSPAEGLVLKAPATGTYYAVVEIQTSDTGATGAGDYLLSISRNCGGGKLWTVAPCRAVDTRAADAPALTHGVARSFPLFGACGVPPSAKAVALNVTAVAAAGTGYLTVYPGDLSTPTATSVVNFGAGAARASLLVVGVAGGSVTVLPTVAAGGQVDLVIDVTGYFE